MSDSSVSFEIFHEEISKLIDENVQTKRITKKMLRTSGKTLDNSRDKKIYR